VNEPSAVPSSPRLLGRGFTALLLANAGFGFAFSSFFLLPKWLVVDLAATPLDIGLVALAHGLGVIPTLPLMGALVDRFGRRDFLTGGALVMAAASAGYDVVDQVGPLLFVLRFVQGVAFATAFAAGGALAVDEAPPGRIAQAVGIYGLSFLSMNAVAPAVAEELALQVGWWAAFVAAACGALVCALLSRRLRDRPGGPDGGPALAGLLAVARRPSQLRGLAVIALVGTGLCAVFNFYQPYALELGFERVRDFFVAYAAAAITVRAGFGHLMDRWGHRHVSAAALGLYVLVVLSVTAIGTVGLAPVGGALGAAHGVFYPSMNAVAASEAMASERGKVMGLFQAAFQLGNSGAGPPLGALAGSAGYPAVFQAAALCLFGALLILVL
jgi:predicted MFS family arabinose efflux permease